VIKIVEILGTVENFSLQLGLRGATTHL